MYSPVQRRSARSSAAPGLDVSVEATSIRLSCPARRRNQSSVPSVDPPSSTTNCTLTLVCRSSPSTSRSTDCIRFLPYQTIETRGLDADTLSPGMVVTDRGRRTKNCRRVLISSTAATAAGGKGPSPLADAFSPASAAVRMPGMVVESAGCARQKRSAACAPSRPGRAPTAVSSSPAPSIQLSSWARDQPSRWSPSGNAVSRVIVPDRKPKQSGVRPITPTLRCAASASRPLSITRTSIMLKLACTTGAANRLIASSASAGLLADTPQARIFPAACSRASASPSRSSPKASLGGL